MVDASKLVIASDRYNNDVDNSALEHHLLADNRDLEIELLTVSGDDMEQVIAACADADVLLASTREAFTRDVLEHASPRHA